MIINNNQLISKKKNFFLIYKTKMAYLWHKIIKNKLNKMNEYQLNKKKIKIILNEIYELKIQ
jgi:hypothetical protein